MAIETSREIDQSGNVTIKYDDGTFVTLSPTKSTDPVIADSEADESINGGHVFKPEELQ